jgi:hypothetical protein
MPLRSHSQYESALNEASALMGAEAGSVEGNRLVRLSEAIEVWEGGLLGSGDVDVSREREKLEKNDGDETHG